MSATEILQELPNLTPQERVVIYQRIAELEGHREGLYVEESPEMLAAIDEGRRASQNGRAYTPQEARILVEEWTTRLS